MPETALVKTRKKREPLLVPIVLAKAPVIAKRKVTKRGYDKYVEDVVLAFAPAQLPLAMSVLMREARKGTRWACEAILKVHKLIEVGGGVTVNQNNNNLAQANAAAAADGRTFDSIVRKLSGQGTTVEPDFEPIE
jgi:hypothetical protein